MKDIQGIFIAKRIKTVYNVETKTIKEYKNNIQYEIIKISNTQYLTKQTNLESGSIIQLLFFISSNDNYLSSSDNGIDNMFFNDCGKLVHNWSIPIDAINNLTNAHAILDKI
jgi:hypothetical protein